MTRIRDLERRLLDENSKLRAEVKELREQNIELAIRFNCKDTEAKALREALDIHLGVAIEMAEYILEERRPNEEKLQDVQDTLSELKKARAAEADLVATGRRGGEG